MRFVIVSDARTGSNLLVEALNSHPNIACFREVLNTLLEDIDYAVDGYDGTSAEDKDLRARDPMRFVRTRIFSALGGETIAAGFKFHYAHLFGSKNAIEGLIGERSLYIIHLQRRNALRSLVSRRLAESSGWWLDEGGEAKPLAAPAIETSAKRRTLRSALGAFSRSRPRDDIPPPPRTIRLTREECLVTFKVLRSNIDLFSSLFEDHRMISVWYEDLVSDAGEQIRIQQFLGVPPAPLQVTMRRQNPQPLSQLIENYDELKRAFMSTAFAEFFNE